MKQSVCSALLGFLLVLGFSTPALAAPADLDLASAEAGDPLEDLLADGWVIVNVGLLQKQHDDGRMETLGFGLEGRTWHVQQLEQELGQMLVDFERAPSASLDEAIFEHRALLDDARSGLVRARELQADGQGETLSTALKNCTVNYSWNADAASGANAQADASWYHSCGVQASTYAYVSCSKTVWGTTTTEYESDPSGPGWNISSSASCGYNVSEEPSDASRACSSYARGYVDEPGGFHETTDSDSTCMDNPPSVTISGLYSVSRNSSFDCGNVTWTATASGGSGGYSYQWKYDGANVGSNSSTYTRYVCGSEQGFHSVGVTVTDSSSATASDLRGFSVTVENFGGCDDPRTPYVEPCEFEQ